MFITSLSPNPLQLSELIQSDNNSNRNSGSSNREFFATAAAVVQSNSHNNSIGGNAKERNNKMNFQASDSPNSAPFSISAQSLDRLQQVLQDLQEEFENQLDIHEQKEESVIRLKSQMLAADFANKYKEQLSPKSSASRQKSAPISSSSSSSVQTNNAKSPRPTTFDGEHEHGSVHRSKSNNQFVTNNLKTEKHYLNSVNNGATSPVYSPNNSKEKNGRQSESERPVSSSTATTGSDESEVIMSPDLVKVGAGSPQQERELRKKMVEKWAEVTELEKELDHNRDHLKKRFTQIQQIEDEIQNISHFLKKPRPLAAGLGHGLGQSHDNSDNQPSSFANASSNEYNQSSPVPADNMSQAASASHSVHIDVDLLEDLPSSSARLLAAEAGSNITMTPSGDRNLEGNSTTFDENSLKPSRIAWISCVGLNVTVLIVTVVIVVVTAYTS